MNAAKHGFIVRLVKFPTQNAAEFNARMLGFFDEYRPRRAFSGLSSRGGRVLFVSA